MLNKIKNFFVLMYQAMVEARELKAKTYVEYYKKNGYYPDWGG